MNLIDLLSDLDKVKSRQNARRVLGVYRKLKRLAIKGYDSKVTTTYSFEPKSFTGEVPNPIENHFANQSEAVESLKKIELAINLIDNPQYRQALYFKFCDMDEKTDMEICKLLNYSNSGYYRLINEALFIFSNIYDGGSLLVHSSGRGLKGT